MANRLVIISSRVLLGSDRAHAGSLPGVLRSVLDHQGSALWFGWNGRVGEAPVATVSVTPGRAVSIAGVEFSAEHYRGHCNGFAANMLWPVFHGLPPLGPAPLEDLTLYQAINDFLAAKLVPLLEPGDRICIYGHQMIPMARSLRKAGVTSPLGFFLDLPFPDAEDLIHHPWHAELAADLVAYDMIGFQSRRDQSHFEGFLQRVRSRFSSGGGQPIRPATGVFPIGIDSRAVVEHADLAGLLGLIPSLSERFHGQTTILTLDPFDYRQSQLWRFLIFERFREIVGQAADSTCLVQLSKTGASELHLAGEMALAGPRPEGQRQSSYIVSALGDQLQLSAICRYSRIGLAVLRGAGTNLAAREYVAAQDPSDPGVLVLSRDDSAAAVLDGALAVDPANAEDCARGLVQALTMGRGERRDRWRRMMIKILHNDAASWHDAFLAALPRIRPLPSNITRLLVRPHYAAIRDATLHPQTIAG